MHVPVTQQILQDIAGYLANEHRTTNGGCVLLRGHGPCTRRYVRTHRVAQEHRRPFEVSTTPSRQAQHQASPIQITPRRTHACPRAAPSTGRRHGGRVRQVRATSGAPWQPARARRGSACARSADPAACLACSATAGPARHTRRARRHRVIRGSRRNVSHSALSDGAPRRPEQLWCGLRWTALRQPRAHGMLPAQRRISTSCVEPCRPFLAPTRTCCRHTNAHAELDRV
jgi:hypothetical protein